MTPTLAGRLQTRIFLVAVVGSIWTLIVTPLLPGGGSEGVPYSMTFSILLVVGVAGLGWEFVYQGIQQFRSDRQCRSGGVATTHGVHS